MSNIVIAGAAGWSGRALIGTLATAGVNFCALTHSDAGEQRLRDAGVSAVARADYAELSTLRAAFSGAEVVFAIPPALHQREDDYLINAVNAAEASGVRRFVYVSVMHPNTPFLRNHLRKSRVEAALRSSGLAWTILQPSMFAQVLFAMFGGQPAGPVGVPFDLDRDIAVLDLAEFAEVAARVLTESGLHDYATYELAGPLTTMRAVVRALGRARGMDAAPELTGVAEGPVPPTATNDPEAIADLISTFAHYHQHGFRGNSFVFTQLLGRNPATFDEIVAREFKAAAS